MTLAVVATVILLEWLFDLRYPYIFDLDGMAWRAVSLVSVALVYAASALTLWLRWSGRLAVAPVRCGGVDNPVARPARAPSCCRGSSRAS